MIHELKSCNGNTKGAIFLLCFRISAFFSKSILLRIVGFPIRVFYKIMFDWLFGIDVKDSTRIGYGFNVFHGHGLVIGADVIIGDYVKVRQCTTIGNAKSGGRSPVIGNWVDIGANSVVIGDIQVGDHVIIAAGSVVVKTVPSYSLVAGNPARIIKQFPPIVRI